MGLDLYAGSLTRYLSGDWETIVQREFGARIVHAFGSPWVSKAEAARKVEAWKVFLRSEHAQLRELDWAESEEVGYASDKPDHEGKNALVLWAAHLARPDVERPKERVGDPEKYVVYEDAVEMKYYFGPMAIFECQAFVPWPEQVYALTRNWNDDDIAISTTASLKAALEYVNAASWQAGPEDLNEWRRNGLPSAAYYERQEVKPFWPWQKQPRMKYVRIETPEAMIDPFQQAAQHAFSIYNEMLRFSEEHNVPIVVDS